MPKRTTGVIDSPPVTPRLGLNCDAAVLSYCCTACCCTASRRSAASLLLLSVTGYIFSLQFSGILGSAVCLVHATFHPPVARTARNARSGGDPELHGGDGDGDLEGGSTVGRGRAGPVNANMRLRTRPTAAGAMGMATAPPMGGGSGGIFRENVPPMVDPSTARLHSHAT